MAVTVTAGDAKGTEATRKGETFADERGFTGKIFRASDGVTTGIVLSNASGLVYAYPNGAGNGWTVSTVRP